MKFKATATAEDIIKEVKDSNHFPYTEDTKFALKEGKLCADITEELYKLTGADLVIVQFPLYWFTLPVITKGWTDWVLTLGLHT